MLASVTIYSDYRKIHYLVSEVDFYIYVCLSMIILVKKVIRRYNFFQYLMCEEIDTSGRKGILV